MCSSESIPGVSVVGSWVETGSVEGTWVETVSVEGAWVETKGGMYGGRVKM